MPLNARPIGAALAAPTRDAEWLARFHGGARDVMEECYREHFATVLRAVGRVVRGVDRETIVQEVFFRLLSSAKLRAGFQGGSLAGWLATVAHHQAVDTLRHYGRELPRAELELGRPDALGDEAEARLLVERFRRECLPPRWERVFQARFLEQRSQREAAALLGLARTTLAYQEHRIRRLLKRFFLEGRTR